MQYLLSVTCNTSYLLHVIPPLPLHAIPPSPQVLLVSASAGTGLRIAGDGGGDSSSRFVMLTHPDKLRDFCGVLLPLMHKLWNNMLPDNTKLRGGVTMTNTSANCLWCLVDLQRVLSSMVSTCTGGEVSQVCEWVKTL